MSSSSSVATFPPAAIATAVALTCCCNTVARYNDDDGAVEDDEDDDYSGNKVHTVVAAPEKMSASFASSYIHIAPMVHVIFFAFIPFYALCSRNLSG